MALNTYPDLVQAVDRWLDRDDLVDQTPDFISLSELRINRRLRVIDMEATARTPIVAEQYYYALPCDFVSARNIYTDDTGAGNMEYITPDIFTSSSTTNAYTIVDGQIKLKYLSGSNLVVEYYRKYPHLSTVNQSNWMTENAYDLLLYGSLLEAEAYLQTDERLQVWINAYERAMEDLNDQAVEGRYSGDALVIRAG